LFRSGHEAIELPHTVQAVAGVETGIWVATTGGLFWIAGGNLKALRRVRWDDRPYASGSLVLSGSEIAQLEAPGPVAVFVSEDGPVCGLPSGTARLLTDDRLALSSVASKYASIVYRKSADINQILFSLE
jgi:hypothetical protein